jgi:molybdenum cofactor biosynthesis enzyme MoaA
MCFEEKTMKPQVDPNYTTRIYAAMPYLEELKVFGGEPFSCKVSREIIFSEELQQHPQVHLSMVTNGSLLDEKALSLFERQRLGFISFSLDSAKPDTYELVRVRGKLDRTMTGISNFLERRASGRIRVRDVTFSMTLQRENFSEVAHFVRFAHEHGVSPTFGLVNGFDHLLDELPLVQEAILEGISVASSLGERAGTASLENLLESLPGYRSYLEQVRFERRRPKWMWDLLGDERMERLKAGLEGYPRAISLAKGALALEQRRRAGRSPRAQG